MAPVVCVPGTLCDESLFAPLDAALGGGLIARPAVHEPDVGAAAKALLNDAPERFIALGFSMGGFVALELLRRAPERLHGVIVAGTSVHAPPPEQKAARRADLDEARRDGVRAYAERRWRGQVAPHRRDDLSLGARITGMAEAAGIDAFAAQTGLAISRPDSTATVAETRVPLLALGGEMDALCPAPRCTAAGRGPTGTVAMLPGCGHFIPLEAAQAAAEAIRRWQRTL